MNNIARKISLSGVGSIHNVTTEESSMTLGIAVNKCQLFVCAYELWLVAYKNVGYRTTCEHLLHKSPSETILMPEEAYGKAELKRRFTSDIKDSVMAALQLLQMTKT
jgi:hypothetical protein